MSCYPIDTHATVRGFEAAGIETMQAEAMVKAMAWNRNGLIALRAEMAVMKSDLEKQISMISMSALIVGLMKYL